ncbi:hypothetical protein ACIQPR_10740 [Streptomyces sp. NPDC091280]|uniref:hypothetical protein n=1 Tax=Streptomyces sp. NPDC091280 TaxID=3365984 RepID=UPI0038231F16
MHERKDLRTLVGGRWSAFSGGADGRDALLAFVLVVLVVLVVFVMSSGACRRRVHLHGRARGPATSGLVLLVHARTSVGTIGDG